MPERFERECGFTRADWERCLPEAVAPGEVAWLDEASSGNGARVNVGATGSLTLRWWVLPERRIAMMRMPRLTVTFAFDGLSDTDRRDFLRQFDRVMQRGGG